MFENYRSQTIAVMVMAVFFFFALVWGGFKGYDQAKAKTIVTNSQTLMEGLQYFYNDQNRYPTLQEFADNNLMLNYFNPFPARPILSSGCSQNLIYKTTSYQSYELDFCLPGKQDKFQKGWNKLTN